MKTVILIMSIILLLATLTAEARPQRVVRQPCQIIGPERQCLDEQILAERWEASIRELEVNSLKIDLATLLGAQLAVMIFLLRNQNEKEG